MNTLSKVAHKAARRVIRLVIRLCWRNLDPHNPVHRSIANYDQWQE